MRLGPAHIGHVPGVFGILWAFTRDTAWLPRVRSLLADLRVMRAVIRRGWVRVTLHAREGFAAAGWGTGNDENLPDIRMIWHAREAL